MTSYAPGTPESVIRELDKKFYGNKRDKSKMPPPPYGSTPLPLPPKRPDPIPPRPGRPTPLPQPVNPLPPMPKRPDPAPPMRPYPGPGRTSPVITQPGPGRTSPVITQKPALRPTGKPSKQMEYKKGGSVPSASKRADGIATKGKTRGKMC